MSGLMRSFFKDCADWTCQEVVRLKLHKAASSDLMIYSYSVLWKT